MKPCSSNLQFSRPPFGSPAFFPPMDIVDRLLKTATLSSQQNQVRFVEWSDQSRRQTLVNHRRRTNAAVDFSAAFDWNRKLIESTASFETSGINAWLKLVNIHEQYHQQLQELFM